MFIDKLVACDMMSIDELVVYDMMSIDKLVVCDMAANVHTKFIDSVIVWEKEGRIY